MCFALVNLLVRYPGDPQGQAWVGGARQYMAIKRVGGLDVACFWKEEWQEMRFEWLDWLGMVGNSHKIWLYQLYLVIKVWLNNFLLLNVLGRFRMVTYLKPFKGISISMAMRWAPGISGTSWTCWMIPGVEMTLETLERWHHMPPSPSSVDMGWLMTTTPQLKKRDSYHHFLTRWFLVAIFLYIWMLGLFAPLA